MSFKKCYIIILTIIMVLLTSCDTRNDILEDTIADAPVITITLEEDHVSLHDTVKITLEATSEVGLLAMWWYAEREDLGPWSLALAIYRT